MPKMGCNIPGDCTYRRAVRIHRHCGRCCGHRPVPLLPVYRHFCNHISLGDLCREENVLAARCAELGERKLTARATCAIHKNVASAP